MGRESGFVIDATKIMDNGSAASRFNIVLVAEGYQFAEMAQFNQQAQAFVAQLFATRPFSEMQPAINVYRLNVCSSCSGAAGDESSPLRGDNISTYFDAIFTREAPSGTRPVLRVDAECVLEVVNEFVPQWHQIIVIVNSEQCGGRSGVVATTSVARGWEQSAVNDLKLFAFCSNSASSSWDGLAQRGGASIAGKNISSRYGLYMDTCLAQCHEEVTMELLPLAERSRFLQQLFFRHLQVSGNFWSV